MAYSVNWITKVITIPVTDLTLVSGTRYQLNLEAFLTECRRLEWEQVDGLWAPHILEHDNIRTDFAGANYAAFDEVVNGYTVTIGAGASRIDLVGSNNNIADVINNTNIILTSANSAGLTNINEIRAAAFNGKIAINTGITGTAGQVYPIGTAKTPCNNISDAIAIAEREGIVTFGLSTNLTVSSTDFSSGFNWIGDRPTIVLTIDAGANFLNNTCRFLTIMGEVDGGNTFIDCHLAGITSVSGTLFNCGISADMKLNNHISIYECYSELGGVSGILYLDYDNLDITATVRDFKGSMGIKNYIHSGDQIISIEDGRHVIDATVTGGIWSCRGRLTVAPEDNSTGTADVRNDGLVVTNIQELHSLQGLDPLNPMTVTPTSRTAGSITQQISGDGETSSTVTTI